MFGTAADTAGETGSTAMRLALGQTLVKLSTGGAAARGSDGAMCCLGGGALQLGSADSNSR
jgi:hypothetical protein